MFIYINYLKGIRNIEKNKLNQKPKQVKVVFGRKPNFPEKGDTRRHQSINPSNESFRLKPSNEAIIV